MQLLQLIAALPLLMGLATAGGIILPGGLPDGNYVASIDSNGNVVHQNVKTGGQHHHPRVVDDGSDSPTTLVKRQKPTSGGSLGGGQDDNETRCGCGLKMNPQNCDDAVANLKWQVAFACTYNDVFGGTLTSTLYASRLAKITQDCGRYVPGTRLTGSFDAIMSGYMNYRENLDFRASAMASPLKKCWTRREMQGTVI
ncbi:hypothetical protein PspLS_07133 [Pyricularia sp. CBS 133598]|nr:hypothetical protein PspLS_07133 [Pyricularia sp. CBS 133598]